MCIRDRASSAAFVDKNDPPVFFFNGTKDKLVPLAWTQSCYRALKSAGVKTEMHTIEGAGHMAAAANRDALKKAYAFMSRELLGQPTTDKESKESAKSLK